MKQVLKCMLILTIPVLLYYFKPYAAYGQELEDVLSGFAAEVTDHETGSGESGMDDLLSGFDEPETTLSTEEENHEEGKLIPHGVKLAGNLAQTGSVNFTHDPPEENEADYRGLSMLRSFFSLSSEMRLGTWQAKIGGHGFYDAAYSIQGRDRYSDQLLDLYEHELEFDDVYLAGSLTSFLDIKAGRQIVVWGKSDNIRVTDILNPLDNRVPGMVDMKNLRLPVTMTKLDYYTGAWNLSGIVIHEVRFSRNPVYNSDFFPGETPLPPEEKLGWSLDNQQYAIALNGIFSGFDLSLYGASVYDDRAHVEQNRDGSFYREHCRIAMGGATTNIAVGSWLLKGEVAWFDGLEYANSLDRKFSRFDVMAGVEYMGIAETVLSLEIVNRHIVDFEKQLELAPNKAQEDAIQTVAKIVRDFANDTVQLKILCSIFGGHGEDGSFERLQLDYDLTDAITLTGGIVFYQAGDQGALSGVEDNDRVFFELAYRF